MAALPVEVLFGLYLGLLTGIVPAFVSGALGFAFKYLTGVTLPGLGVVVLAVAIAGINGGLMGLLDPAVANSPRIVTAAVVVMMLSLYAHSQGDKLGVALPKRFSLRRLREQTLSGEALDVFGGATVQVTGAVGDMEGYPPLPADLRSQIAASSWSFPGDLPLSELESRLAERLRTEFELTDVAVSVDARGRATVAGAPPVGGLSRRVPKGKRAVSVTALLPTGVARGDTVVATVTRTERAPESTEPADEVIQENVTTTDVRGTVLSAKTTDADPPKPRVPGASTAGDALTDGGTDETVAAAAPTAPTTEGGEGRVTLAVDRSDAAVLLRADRARVRVTSRGTHREFELVSLLRRAGNRFRRTTVRADGPLDGVTIGEVGVRDTYGVAIMAARRPQRAGEGASGRQRSWFRRERGRRTGADTSPTDQGWAFSPRGDAPLQAGDELFVVGRPDALRAFEEAVA